MKVVRLKVVYYLASASIFIVSLVTAKAASAQVIWPIPTWQTATPSQMGMNEAKLNEAKNYALTGGGSGIITRGGKVVMSWGSQTQKYDLKSTTKSFGATAVGLAIKDGKFTVASKAQPLHFSFGVPPSSNTSTGWLDDITIKHLLTQTAGFDKDGGYTSLMFSPGSKWSYSDGGPNWLAEVTTLAYQKDLKDLMFERVFTPIGISSTQLSWRNNAYRDPTIQGVPNREFGSGISASVDAMARFGYLFLRNGNWNGNQIITQSYIDQLRINQSAGLPVVKPETYFNASSHYGYLWWNNASNVMNKAPADTYFSHGLYDSFVIVIPSLDIVAARAAPTGGSFNCSPTSDYVCERKFIEPIAESVISSPNLTPTIKPSTSPAPSTKPGDANGDGKVDGLDYVIWLTNYGKTVSGGVSSGDFNNDNKVDGLDYVIWLTNYGK